MLRTLLNSSFHRQAKRAPRSTRPPRARPRLEPLEDRLAPAGITVQNFDGVTTVMPGQLVTYTIVVTNTGNPVSGATVSDDFPATLTGVNFTSAASGGATGNSASGIGNINDTVAMPTGSTITYSASATVASSATGTLSDTATASSPGGLGSNSATENNPIIHPDLSISNTDGVSSVMPGQAVTYTITVSNNGPVDVTGATVTDLFPATLTGVNFTSVSSGGATGNTFAGAGNINDTVFMPVGSSITYTASATVAAGAVGVLNNTATVALPASMGADATAADNVATARNAIPDANHAFVQTLYNDFLGRNGIAPEIAGWVSVLPVIGQAGVASGISRSPEALTHVVNTFYVKLLGQAAGGGEERGWVTSLENGATEEQVMAGMLSSPEFASHANALIGGGNTDSNFVRALYQLLLLRTGAGTEVNGWLGVLPAMGRKNVALGFLGSPEFRTNVVSQLYVGAPVVTQLYLTLEDRVTAPSAAEVTGWVSSGLDILTIEAMFATGPEYLSNG